MLRSMNDLENCAIRAIDGPLGHVRDLYFDDKRWVTRYLVVKTGTWLSNRKVLIAPTAIGHPNWAEKTLPVSITKEEVENSPGIDTEKPVSRQHDMQYLGYYHYPFYWRGEPISSGGCLNRIPGYAGEEDAWARVFELQRHDPHLYSCKAVMGYHIHATDGSIGHVRDMLVDEDTWAIRYMIVMTSNWWSGREVLIASEWIEDVSGSDGTVFVNQARQAVKDAPTYDPSTPPSTG